LSDAGLKERSCPQCGAGLSWPAYADIVVCSSCGSTLAADGGLRAVECPQCAGPLAVVGGSRLLACCHCGVHLLVASRGGYDRWRLPLRADRHKAEGVAREWLGTYPGVADSARSASFTLVQLVYAPIWEYSALVAGWEFGYKARIRAEVVGHEQNGRLELQPVRETVHEGYLQERRFYDEAADVSAIGAVRPRITGREVLLPVLAGDLDSARVLPEKGSAAETLARGHVVVVRPTSDAERPDSHLAALHESASLLFYPLWLFEYREETGSYAVVVNGYDGTVNAAVAPAGRMKRLQQRLAAAFQETGGQGTVEYHDPISS
jgi:hypothetical protein